MSTYSEVDEKSLSLTGMSDELFTKVRRSVGFLGTSQKGDLFQGTEKRSRREIANCNERRRMQSINTGFESLKTLLPTDDGEKLSKAAILQLTSKYIQHLVGENRRMRDQLSQMQQQQQQQRHTDLMLEAPDGASRKRKIAGGDGGGGGGGGGVYIGYFPQQHGNTAAVKSQPQPQRTFQLAVKPDYEQFVIEPAAVLNQPQTPQPTKPKRLEHLMMAIERIEGKSTRYPPAAASPSAGSAPDVATDSDSDRQLLCSQTPPDAPQEQERQQPQQQLLLHQPAVMISPFTPHCENSNNQLDAEADVVVDLADGGQLCRPRSMPHKYLHRPQVVEANRSN